MIIKLISNKRIGTDFYILDKTRFRIMLIGGQHNGYVTFSQKGWGLNSDDG